MFANQVTKAQQIMQDHVVALFHLLSNDMCLLTEAQIQLRILESFVQHSNFSGIHCSMTRWYFINQSGQWSRQLLVAASRSSLPGGI